jgi:hypothetical protein
MIGSLNGHVKDDRIKWVAVAVTAMIVLLSGLLYVRFVVNRLARSRLSLDGDALTVRGQTSGGLVERRYSVGQLAAITLGERLNATERIMDRLVLTRLVASAPTLARTSAGVAGARATRPAGNRLVQVWKAMLKRGITPYDTDAAD